MIKRLGRIKTTYDDEANYDTEAYFREKCSVYQKQISFASRVDVITNEQFALKPLDVDFVKSVVLQDQPKFKQIRKIYYQYNKQLAAQAQFKGQFGDEGKAEKGFHLKTVVMKSMLKFMRIMLLAPDIEARIKILNVAYEWFIFNLDPKMKRKNAKELEKQIQNKVVETKVLPYDLIQKQLIATKRKNDTYDYKIRARTLYDELDPPQMELENYYTHKYGDAIENERKKNEVKKHWIQTLKFPRIQQPTYYESESEKPKEEEIPKQESQPPQQPLSNEQIQQQVENKLEGEIKVENKEVDVELDFGNDPGEEEGQIEEPEIEQKKRGKLDPLVKAFVLERQLPKQKQEYHIERFQQRKVNKYEQMLKQDFTSVQYMKKERGKRSRMKTQLARKIQSVRGLDKIARGRLLSSQPKYIEHHMNNIRINETLKECRKDISQGEFNRENLNTEAGISLFDRKRIRTEQPQRPFSTIMEDYSRKNEQSKILGEINEIKSIFAKNKLYAPLEKFVKGLGNPVQEEEKGKKHEDQAFLPPCQLLSNPYIKIAKKKKKKKKK